MRLLLTPPDIQSLPNWSLSLQGVLCIVFYVCPLGNRFAVRGTNFDQHRRFWLTYTTLTNRVSKRFCLEFSPSSSSRSYYLLHFSVIAFYGTLGKACLFKRCRKRQRFLTRVYVIFLAQSSWFSCMHCSLAILIIICILFLIIVEVFVITRTRSSSLPTRAYSPLTSSECRAKRRIDSTKDIRVRH